MESAKEKKNPAILQSAPAVVEVIATNEGDASAPPSFPPPDPKLNGCDDDGLEPATTVVEVVATSGGDAFPLPSFPPPWLPKLND